MEEAEEMAKEAALIEKYGSRRTIPDDRRDEICKARVLASMRGFCAPYPFLIPGLAAPADGD